MDQNPTFGKDHCQHHRCSIPQSTRSSWMLPRWIRPHHLSRRWQHVEKGHLFHIKEKRWWLVPSNLWRSHCERRQLGRSLYFHSLGQSRVPHWPTSCSAGHTSSSGPGHDSRNSRHLHLVFCGGLQQAHLLLYRHRTGILLRRMSPNGSHLAGDHQPRSNLPRQHLLPLAWNGLLCPEAPGFKNNM